MDNTPKRLRSARDRRLVPPPSMRLTERDIDVVQAVYEYRLLTTEHLQSLFFPSRHQAYTRLHLLYHNAYLDRILRSAHADKMHTPMLYVLDKRGADLLRRERGIEVEWKKSPKGATFAFLEHALDISTVRVAIARAAQATNCTLKQWIGENELKGAYDFVTLRSETGRMKRISVIPDSYFVLETPRGIAHFLLELDRGTETIGRFKTKIQAYQAYYASGGYERRYGTRSLRVLTVTSSIARLDNLRRATEMVGGKQRYWFTTLNTLNPNTVLTAPIWQVATSPGEYPLIEMD